MSIKDKLDRARRWAAKCRLLGDNVEVGILSNKVSLLKYETSCNKVQIPSSIDRIEDGAFRGSRNTNLTEITISNGITEIGQDCFHKELYTLTIPESIIEVTEDLLFQNYVSKIILQGEKHINTAALNCLEELEEVENSHFITRIDMNGIINSLGIKLLDLRNASIEPLGIEGCSIHTIKIGKNTKLYESSFNKCVIDTLEVYCDTQAEIEAIQNYMGEDNTFGLARLIDSITSYSDIDNVKGILTNG